MRAIVLLLAAMSLTGCINFTSPDAGEEVVLVRKPWVFGTGGVDRDPLATGLHWKVWSTHAYTFNLKPYQIKENFTDLFSNDNVPVNFNAYIQVQVKKGETPRLLEEFGQNWYETKIQEVFRTYVRSFAKDHAVFKLTTDEEVVESGQTEILKLIKDYAQKENIPVDILKVVIGRIAPPDAVVKQTEQTAAQRQRYKTEEQRGKAEEARKIAEAKRALADREYRNKFGMSTKEYIQLQTIEMLNKKENLTIIMGGGVQPVIGIK